MFRLVSTEAGRSQYLVSNVDPLPPLVVPFDPSATYPFSVYEESCRYGPNDLGFPSSGFGTTFPFMYWGFHLIFCDPDSFFITSGTVPHGMTKPLGLSFDQSRERPSRLRCPT